MAKMIVPLVWSGKKKKRGRNVLSGERSAKQKSKCDIIIEVEVETEKDGD